MIANQIFSGTLITYVLGVFYPTASATAKGQRPKFVRAEHLATAEGENCAYGPTLEKVKLKWISKKSSVLKVKGGNATIIDSSSTSTVVTNLLCQKL